MGVVRSIKVKKYVDIIEEYDAAAAITPGMLVELTSAGKVQAHSSAGQNILPVMVALEDELQGNDVDDDYAADDKVQVWVPQRGEQAYMILADGEDVAIGDALESNGAGKLQKHTEDVAEGGSSQEAVTDTTIYTNQIAAVALEAKDLSSSSALESSGQLGYDKYIKVRIV